MNSSYQADHDSYSKAHDYKILAEEDDLKPSNSKVMSRQAQESQISLHNSQVEEKISIRQE